MVVSQIVFQLYVNSCAAVAAEVQVDEVEHEDPTHWFTVCLLFAKKRKSTRQKIIVDNFGFQLSPIVIFL